jgi:UPF0042 nucleotide-binding protein
VAGTVIVTGMSGAGRMSCLKILEDLAFEAIDNVPLTLFPRLLDPGGPQAGGIAIGIDSRTRGFTPARLIDQIQAHPGTRLLFLECADEVLARRFTETRRRHPLAADRPVADGIAMERLLFGPLKALADLVIDTSQLPLAGLRRLIAGHFGPQAHDRLTLAVTSFSFRHGLPREADIVLDVRFLRNPHYDARLRPLTGLDPPVQAYVRADPTFAGFIAAAGELLLPLLPSYRSEGKSYLTVAVGCTGGQHRSVFIAETLGRRMREAGWEVAVIHRDLPVPRAPGSGATGSQA